MATSGDGETRIFTKKYRCAGDDAHHFRLLKKKTQQSEVGLLIAIALPAGTSDRRAEVVRTKNLLLVLALIAIGFSLSAPSHRN